MAESWRMFAHRYEDGQLYNLGEKWWVQVHGLSEPIVEVDVTEVAVDDESGTHWGWLRSTRDVPEMIWPKRFLLGMCFPYGPEIEEKSGKGRVVRLAVREIEASP